jgi:DNA repair and recombination protein RAD52
VSFTHEQTAALQAPLVLTHVKTREQAGRKLSYVEAWWAISEANRIFGFDSWNRETVELRLLGEPRLTGDKWRVGYMAKVRITVGAIVREGCGFGSGIDKDVDQAHESALKEAESDAMKRALMTFGNPFGLALYDKTQANVVNTPPGVITGTQLLEQQAPRDVTPPHLSDPQSWNQRKAAAQAKRDGDDTKIKADIAKADKDGLRDWHENFDSYTAHIPVSWLDSVRDMLEVRLEELNGEAAVAEEDGALDEAFRASLGPAGPSALSGRNAPHSPAR